MGSALVFRRFFHFVCCRRGYARMARNALLTAVLAGVVGCKTQDAQPPIDAQASVEIFAPDAIRLPAENQAAGAIMKLPITIRLRNHRKRAIELRASTPCAVFRWQVVVAGEVVQLKPNRLCAQVVATDSLEPAQQLEQSYVLSLDPRRYIVGGRYRLVYTFWGYPDQHDFAVKKRR